MTQPKPFETIAVIGGGAWGTALASLCANAGVDTVLWARENEVVESINTDSENTMFLPGAELPAALKATSSLDEISERAAFLFVAPVQFSRPILAELSTRAAQNAPVALCSKGLERGSSKFMTEILAETWPGAQPAVLSGPSFAQDVAVGMPTAVTLACSDATLGARWRETIGAPHFRPYLSDDLIGAELGGAVKNVLAIAAGAVSGRGFGESARAALIARGFAEFQRLGVALGAKPQTMAGLAGLGDLILTANSPQSRNMSLGFALGQGRSLQDIMAERNTVSEGVATAGAVVQMATEAGVDVPICRAVAALVDGAATMDEIVTDLLSRPFKHEGV
ncbi:MAG: NAD(P)H-dependent glycerol-3-phosphate dehydrogenase [Pseudomonadota bacterium]